MMVFVQFLQLVFFLRGVLPSKWHDWLRINLADYHFKPFAIDWYRYLVFEQSLFSNARPLHKKVPYISLHMQNRWIHFKISSKANWDFNSEKWKFMNRNLYAVYYWHSRKTNNSFVQISWRQSCMRRWRRRLVDIWSFLTKFLTFQDQGYLSRFKIPTKKRGLFFRFWENSLCCRLLFFLFSCFP